MSDRDKYLSVTTVLGKYFDKSRIPKAALEKAAPRGSKAHSAALCYAMKAYSRHAKDPEIVGYLESFRAWFDEYVETVIFAEVRFFNDPLRFKGKPDLGCRLISGESVVVDYKTPITESPLWRIQLSGYLDLVKKDYPEITRGMVLMLDPFGRPAKAKTYEESARDFAAFVAALQAHRYILGENK